VAKTAVVTGSAGGIGRAICKVFRESGYRVVGVDLVRGTDDLDAFVAADIATTCLEGPEKETVIRDIRRGLGEHELVALVNNAAVQILGAVSAIRHEDWNRTQVTNVHAPFALTQALLSDLESAGGSVVNIASVHAIATKPGFVAYATSKAALVGLTRAMAVDLAGRVRVNAILPGAIDTDMLRQGFADRPEALAQLVKMHPVGRLGRADEVARAAVYLASSDAQFANGAVWNLDGGILSRLYDSA
jgi:NAD(P)-dependent dehydrogenase (short-subunit alcohol dehydrogenase family)